MTRQSACKFLETDVVGALAATGLVALFGVMDQISLAIVFCASLLGVNRARFAGGWLD